MILIGYTLQIREKDFLKNRMLTPNVQGVRLSGNHSAEIALTIEDGFDFMLYKTIAEDSFEIVRGVFGTSDVFGLSGFISTGRFFEREDYENSLPAAVVGRHILPVTFEENGKRYYGYNRRMYEVIGVFHETGTPLDDAVYLNLNYVTAYESGMGQYYADAKEAETAEAVIRAWEKSAAGEYHIEPSPRRLPAYELNLYTNELLRFSIMTAVFCLLLTAIFFVARQKYTVSVQKLCGMTRQYLTRFYGSQVMMIMAAAFLCIVPATLLLSKHVSNSIFSMKAMACRHYIVTGAALAVLGGCVTGFIVRLADGVNISDTLKGR